MSKRAKRARSEAQGGAEADLRRVDGARAGRYSTPRPRRSARRRSPLVGSVIKKRRKKMRKHKKRKLLKRARHKRKR